MEEKIVFIAAAWLFACPLMANATPQETKPGNAPEAETTAAEEITPKPDGTAESEGTPATDGAPAVDEAKIAETSPPQASEPPAGSPESASPNMDSKKKILLVGFKVPSGIPLEYQTVVSLAKEMAEADGHYQLVLATTAAESPVDQGGNGAAQPSGEGAQSAIPPAAEPPDDQTEGSPETVKAATPTPECLDESCALSLSRRIGAHAVLMGQMMPNDSQSIVQIEIELINVETGRTTALQRKMVAPPNRVRLIDGLKELLSRVLRDLPREKPVVGQSLTKSDLFFKPSQSEADWSLGKRSHDKGEFIFRFGLLCGYGGTRGKGSSMSADSDSDSVSSPGYYSYTSTESLLYPTDGKSPFGGLSFSFGGNVARNIAVTADYQFLLGTSDIKSTYPSFLATMRLGPGITVYVSPINFFFSATVGWANLLVARRYYGADASSSSSYDGDTPDEIYLEKANGLGTSMGVGFEFWSSTDTAVGFTMLRGEFSALFDDDRKYFNWKLLTGFSLTRN